jgi:hypothetical protein
MQQRPSRYATEPPRGSSRFALIIIKYLEALVASRASSQ